MESQNEPEKGICIVSFDGGGPGSISQLRFIEEILTRIECDLDVEEGSLFAADYWDLMGGVGFGGLCALLLGCLRLSIADAMDELARIGSAIFPQDVSEITTPEANLTTLRETIEDMLQRHQFPVNIKLNDKALQSSRCKVVVFAASTSVGDGCHRFRTYRSRHSSLPCTFVEAVCAALATPPWLSPMAIGPQRARRHFTGTPFGFNNPIRPVLEEARSIFRDDGMVSLILSLGSGRPAVLSLNAYAPRLDGLQELLISVVSDCERVAREISNQLFDFKGYLRLNVDRGMESIKISDWDQLGSISSHTDDYLLRPDIESSVDNLSRLFQERSGSTFLGQLNWSGSAVGAKCHTQQYYDRFILSPTGVKQMSDIVRDAVHGITVVDAIGNRVQIPMEWCRTYSMLQDMILLYFKHQRPPGIAFVERGDYRLVDADLGDILEPARWTYDLKAGKTMEMSMVLRNYRDFLRQQCPKCHSKVGGEYKIGWIDWKVTPIGNI